MLSFFDCEPHELEAHCVEHGMPRFVAAQVLDWVYRKGVVTPGAMTNISTRNRSVIEATIRFDAARVHAHQTAGDGTEKLLLAWPRDRPRRNGEGDGNGAAGVTATAATTLPVLGAGDEPRTECVMIPTEGRRTACISSQVGCPVGCRFCASGIGGLEGNLSTGRIVEQVHRLGRLEGVGRISNVVFMGMGEPLANFTAVIGAVRTINASWGMGIGIRKITISTVGLPAAIRRLAAFELPVTLALSLHAPNDAIRRQLIPWAEYASIDELLDACDAYFAATGREITLEYLLLRGVNDRPEHAHELVSIARRLRGNVNLIRYNEVKGLPYDRPTTADVRIFQEILRSKRVNAHIRASRGRDIAAACGQLRHERRGSASRAS